MSLLTIENLSISLQKKNLLEPINLQLNKGERLTILGQTGSGKSLLAQAIMGNLPSGMTYTGSITLFNQLATDEERRSIWGRKISMLPQEPWNALDPLMPTSEQIRKTYQLVAQHSAQMAREKTNHVLQHQGLSASGHKRVHQLSGGMAQRIAIACAMAGGAELLLADEPTKGLDVSRRDQTVQQLIEQTRDGALLTITHDVEVARLLGGQILVVKNGRVVEQGSAEDVLQNPTNAYTKKLMQADPRKWTELTNFSPKQETELLQINNLSIGRGSKILAKDLTMSIKAGQVVGVVGDSGCGKSTFGDTLLGLHNAAGGSIKKRDGIAKYKWQKLYQDPTAAISKSATLNALLADLVKRHRIEPTNIDALMQRLGLPKEILTRKANEVSGGELQRFCLLRVLLLEPAFLFADEPTSRLDPVTTKDVTQLLVELAHEKGCAVMLVSHDPALVEKACDTVLYL